MWAPILRFLGWFAGGLALDKFFGWLTGSATAVAGNEAKKAATGRSIWSRLFSLFERLLDRAGVLVIIVEGVKRLLGFTALGGAVVSGGASMKQIWDLLGSIADPQKAIMDYLSDALSSLPSFADLLNDIDSKIGSITGLAFSPAITFSSMLRMTGVGEAFNQIFMSMIQTLVFIFSIFVVRWAFSSNFTFTKSVNSGRPK